MVRLQDQLSATATDRNGWVVSRTLRQAKELHRDLCQIDEDITQLTLPSKVRLGKPSEEYIRKAEQQITNFLQWVIADKTISQSAELFNFVSTHPHLNTRTVRKSAMFKVPSLFKRKTQETSDNDSGDLLFYNQTETGAKELVSKDSIARPLYSLISEIFELKGAFKLLRKTLVQLAQVMYGKSINRQIRETVDWMISEPMLVYYLKFFRDLFWPGGLLAPPNPARSAEQMAKTKAEASAAFTRNIPEPVIRIFGEKAARRGFTKLLDSCQDQRLNKHLFYMLLSKLTDRLLPEVLAAKQTQYQRVASSGCLTESNDYTSATPEYASQHSANSRALADGLSNQDATLGLLARQQSLQDTAINGTSEQSAGQEGQVLRSTNGKVMLATDRHVYKRYIHMK